jgi:hypothetical protein
MEVADDPVLRPGVEVHQSVAADEQVDPRDRRIVDDVVPSEDHAASQVLADGVPRVVPLEVPVAELLRDVGERLGRIHRVTTLRQRLLVDVGCIDLHPLPELLLAQRLQKQHADRVRLLAGGATGRPDPDVGVLRSRLDDPRQDLFREVIPGRRIAEERRDVDEDRVEELDELVGVVFEALPVSRVVGHADRLHATLEAPRQARALVAREIEASVLLDEEE